MNLNEVSYDIIYELAAEGEIPVMEATYFTSPAVKKIIKEVPKVSKAEFVRQCQPADIIVAFSAKKQFEKVKAAKFFGKLLASAQGSPYSSSKMVLDRNEVAGYGIEIIDDASDNKISTKPLKTFVNLRQEMLLVRIPDLTEAQKKKAISFVRKRVGLDYAGSDLLKTAWNRLFKRKLMPFLKNKPLTPKQINAIQEPLFCSNLISVAFRSAGLRRNFNGKHPYDTWPRDFVLANFTEKICRVEKL